MGRIAVIFNPHAKSNPKEPARPERFREILGDRGRVYETTDLGQLGEVCREVIDSGADLVCFCGGDGTNHLVATALIPAYRQAGLPLPPVHFLRGGSMNTTAGGLGLKCGAEKALAKLLEQRDAGGEPRTVRQGTMRVNEWYAFCFGNGYAANFLEEYYACRFETGPRRAAEVTYKAITSILAQGDFFQRLARPFEAEVLVDGKGLGFPAYGMVLAGFIECIGLGFKPLYRAREQEGSFHVMVTALAPARILAQVHRFFSGKPLVGEHHFDEIAREVVIRCPEVFGFTLDGEMYHDREVVISAGPALDVVLV